MNAFDNWFLEAVKGEKILGSTEAFKFVNFWIFFFFWHEIKIKEVLLISLGLDGLNTLLIPGGNCLHVVKQLCEIVINGHFMLNIWVIG